MQLGKNHRARRSPAAVMPRVERRAEEFREQDLAEIRSVVLGETLADLSHYRTELVQGAVARRMARRDIERIPEYARYMRQFPREAAELLNEVRPNHRGLFQEPATLEVLRTGLYGVLWKERQPGDCFRVWVPCCGTGEEVYSIAITVLEMLEQAGPRGPIQVFGTDLDGKALETARGGVYAEAKAPMIEPERRRRFFRQEDAAYRIRQEVRGLCVFGQHDVSKDPPLTRLDLVVFRNQLGAFTDAVKNRLLERFHHSLKAGGTLLPGQSETLESLSSLFTALANNRGIYVRRGADGPAGGGGVASAEYALQERGAVLPSASRPIRREAAGPESYDIRALLDEQTKAIESLRIANEEIVASNEELQVTNEELLVMREELQAANQELATLNEEIQQRNQILGRESGELRALFRNIDAAVLTLDGQLRVRRFTARAARLFRLTEQDAGRRLADLQPKLQIPELEELLRETAEDLTSHEREARGEDGSLYRVSIRPFRGEDDRIDGAIFTAWAITSK